MILSSAAKRACLATIIITFICIAFIMAYRCKTKNTKSYIKRESKIHGYGMFANRKIKKGEIIDIIIKYSKEGINITPYFGSFINHSCRSNNIKLVVKDGDYHAEAIKDIPKDMEITIDYDGQEIPDYIEGSLPHYV